MSDKNRNRHDTCDRLAAYEMGLLEDCERAAFETHLTDCEDCLTELYVHAPAAVAMTSDPGTFKQAFARSVAAAQPGLWRRLVDWLNNRGGGRVLAPIVVAATLALVLLWPRGEVDFSYGDFAVLDPLVYTHIEVRSGGSDSTAVVFDRGMESYVTGDYVSAVRELTLVRDLLVQFPDSAPARQAGFSDQAELYRGVSLLLAGDVPAAAEALSGAAASPIRPVRERAQWYLVQAHLVSNQPDAAEEFLTVLLNSPVYGSQALALLNALHQER
ncbi:MAG: hypothetical protein ABFS42_02825 [Candidatus Krumholzibacteriota bacterium]